MLKNLAKAFLFFFLLVLPTTPTQAQTTPPNTHLSTFIMQLRGSECCSPGSVQAAEDWITQAQKSKLPLTIAVRYDALLDETYHAVLRQAQQENHELAGYLEITPALASASGVLYPGKAEDWHQANQAFLLGYSQSDRIKIIDTYMHSFRNVTGNYPSTTVAWMIDTFSLRYLAENYGVTVHEITREQWGVDSYSLHGGPTHYPYIPSENWALIPATQNQTSPMPLIVRQTVDDPVWSYGDPTSSYTTQPNDYDLQKRGLDYFRFLFSQAHTQTEPITFSLLGLENSMPAKDQAEFAQQLKIVETWRDESPQNRVVLAKELPALWPANPKVQVYAGQDKDQGKTSQAWWIGTPSYRARVRYEDNSLFLTDIRVYDARWKDPYWNTQALGGAYWTVPFVLDGARFFEAGSTEPSNWNDSLFLRKGHPLPTRIVLTQGLAPDELVVNRTENSITFAQNTNKTLATFTDRNFTLTNDLHAFTQHPLLDSVISEYQWKNSGGEVLWELEEKASGKDSRLFTPRVSTDILDKEREERYSLLHPEIRVRPLDTQKSRLDVKNRYSMLNRNPIRLAFWLKDAQNYPTRAATDPDIMLDNDTTKVQIVPQQLPQGYIFIDLESTVRGTTSVQVKYQDFSQTETVYFVPNCRQDPVACLHHPIDLWRFLQLKFEERKILREQQEV